MHMIVQGHDLVGSVECSDSNNANWCWGVKRLELQLVPGKGAPCSLASLGPAIYSKCGHGQKVPVLGGVVRGYSMLQA